MLGAIHMVACLMPSVCVMICGGPGAQPASSYSYACANPRKGVSPLHASNRPSGWPAAAMEKKGLLPGGLPLRARARISIDPEDPTGMRSNPKMAPLEEPKSFVQPSLLAGDLLQAPDPDRTGSGGAEKYKWGSIDAPREADPGHAKHGRYIEFVYESATSKVSNSTSSNSSPDSQIPERMTWKFWGFYKWGSIDASRRADHARVPLGAHLARVPSTVPTPIAKNEAMLSITHLLKSLRLMLTFNMESEVGGYGLMGMVKIMVKLTLILIFGLLLTCPGDWARAIPRWVMVGALASCTRRGSPHCRHGGA